MAMTILRILMNHLVRKLGHKYNYHSAQNELLNIFGAQVLKEKLAAIRDCMFFSIMADEWSEISNKGQLSFCVRTSGDNLNVDKDFLGFCEVAKIKSETVFNAVKDILLRCSLSLYNCWGQTYHGASNMMGKHTGFSPKPSAEQPKAIETHWNPWQKIIEFFETPRRPLGWLSSWSDILQMDSKCLVQ